MYIRKSYICECGCQTEEEALTFIGWSLTPDNVYFSLPPNWFVNIGRIFYSGKGQRVSATEERPIKPLLHKRQSESSLQHNSKPSPGQTVNKFFWIGEWFYFKEMLFYLFCQIWIANRFAFCRHFHTRGLLNCLRNSSWLMIQKTLLSESNHSSGLVVCPRWWVGRDSR